MKSRPIKPRNSYRYFTIQGVSFVWRMRKINGEFKTAFHYFNRKSWHEGFGLNYDSFILWSEISKDEAQKLCNCEW